MSQTDHPATERQAVKICHVCKGLRVYYLFSACGHRVVRCEDCGLVFLNPQPSDDELARIYNAHYFLGSDSEAGRETVSHIKQTTAKLYLSEIRRYHGLESGRLLEIGCGEGDFSLLRDLRFRLVALLFQKFNQVERRDFTARFERARAALDFTGRECFLQEGADARYDDGRWPIYWKAKRGFATGR